MDRVYKYIVGKQGRIWKLGDLQNVPPGRGWFEIINRASDNRTFHLLPAYKLQMPPYPGGF